MTAETRPPAGRAGYACCTSTIGRPCAHERVPESIRRRPDHGILRVTVLHGCTSAENAHLTGDYPYGRRLRCQRREWLEFKPGQGYRFVTQTTDPRQPGEVWNKPHAGTYSAWAVLVQQEPVNGESFGRIHVWGVGLAGLSPDYHTKFALSGAVSQLNASQAKMYGALLELGRRCYVPEWQRWQETAAVMAANRDESGEPLSRDALHDASGHYLADHVYTAARAAVLAGFDADAAPEFAALAATA